MESLIVLVCYNKVKIFFDFFYIFKKYLIVSYENIKRILKIFKIMFNSLDKYIISIWL